MSTIHITKEQVEQYNHFHVLKHDPFNHPVKGCELCESYTNRKPYYTPGLSILDNLPIERPSYKTRLIICWIQVTLMIITVLILGIAAYIAYWR